MFKQKRITDYITFLVSFVALLLMSGYYSTVHAGTCTFAPDATGVANVSVDCNIPTDSSVYVDYAASESSTSNGSTVQVSSTMTISPGSATTTSLYMGKLEIAAGGSVVIGSASQMKLGASTAYYLTDADADGWAANFTYYTATAAGRRRASLMKSLTIPDCSDSAYNVTNVCCSGNGTSCGADSDCCSSICGTDTDNDGQFSSALGHAGICQGAWKPYTDCYDSNANANASQSAYFTSSRGDGSYDYNCDSSETKSASTYSPGGCTTCAYTTQVEWINGSTTSTPGCGGSYNQTIPNEGYVGNTCYTTTCGSLTTSYTNTTSCH